MYAYIDIYSKYAILKIPDENPRCAAITAHVSRPDKTCYVIIRSIAQDVVRLASPLTAAERRECNAPNNTCIRIIVISYDEGI